MPECRKCKAELKWPQPYNKGDRPVNQDGTAHDCGSDPMKRKKKRFSYNTNSRFDFNEENGFKIVGQFIIPLWDYEEQIKILKNA
jgi:hypothetical protein